MKHKQEQEELQPKCNCSPDCDCGCQQGQPCTCDEHCNCGCQDQACDPQCDCGCQDGGDCACHDECDCSHNDCKCEDECDCGHDECDCNDECDCGDECDCHDDCKCGPQCDCHDDHTNSQAEQYLNLAKQVQADFENFRRHALEDIKEARVAGQRSVIEIFLPCLDTFKEAKKSITDQVILDGVNMIEEKITNALHSLGVEKIETVGKTYNPHLHECIAVVKDESQENDIILNEFQAGYTFNEKVIRYSKVIVNKKED